MRYIEKYLRPGMRILEIGAATGRYSHHLAQQGYQVDAVELVEHNIEIFNQNTKPGENITITQGNAKDLRDFNDNTYDIKEAYALFFQAFPDVLTVPQLSRMLNINEKTAYQLVREKQINHFKIGRTYRIPKMAVLNYLNTVTGVVDSQTCHT